MRRSHEKGASFDDVLKALFLFFLFAGVVFYWVSTLLHRHYMEQIAEQVGTFFTKYETELPGFIRQKLNLNSSKQLINYGLVPECKEKVSVFNKNKQVCALPLGQIEINTEYLDPFYYTYLYIHFTDIYKRVSCENFLSVGWEKLLPQEWWGPKSYIGVMSENTTGKIYFSLNPQYIKNDGAEAKPTEEHIKQVCEVCRDSFYCTILFFFDFDKNLYKS